MLYTPTFISGNTLFAVLETWSLTSFRNPQGLEQLVQWERLLSKPIHTRYSPAASRVHLQPVSMSC